MIHPDYFYLDLFLPPLIFACVIQIILKLLKQGDYKIYLLGLLPFILNILGFALFFVLSYLFFPNENAVKFSQLFNENELNYLSYINGFLSYVAIMEAPVMPGIIMWAQRLGFLILSVLLFYQFRPRVFTAPFALKKRIATTFIIEVMYFSSFLMLYFFSPKASVFNSNPPYLVHLVVLVIATFYFWFQIYWEKAVEKLNISTVLALVVISSSSFSIINFLFYGGSIISAIITMLVTLNFALIRWLWGVKGLIVMLFIAISYALVY